MPESSDTFTAGQAAALLGVSERRVRQLAASGVLAVVSEHPLRLSQVSVVDERKRRRAAPAPATPATGQSLDADQIRELIHAIVSDILPLALEGRDRVENMLRDDLAALRVENMQLRQELAAGRPVNAETDKPKKAKRGKGKKKKKKRFSFGK